ncbi:hypothetical protein [Nonomuraea sp. NPDC048826]|uniref:hypothetical protein n=1 Tax=Nonomuraea sp. NPDC048826 TaxID=3364347 RepID=UPI003712440A
MADFYNPRLTDKQLNDMWKSIKKGPDEDGFCDIQDGVRARPARVSNSDYWDVYYEVNLWIGVRRGVTAKEAMSWIAKHGKSVPFGGCSSPLAVGQRCDLEGVPGWSLFGKKAL